MSKLASSAILVLIVSLFPLQALTAVHARFDLATPRGEPFPSDRFTVPDASQNTRRRVNLPLADCAARQSDCEDLNVINTLDGFNMQPRLRIPFDGPIDVTTVTSETVFLLSLDGAHQQGNDEEREANRGGETHCSEARCLIGINQVVWDAFSDTLHLESNELLAQHRRYALIATRGIRDLQGRPVEASPSFRNFRHTVRGEYRRALLDVIRAAQRIGVREDEIVTASAFSTQSATAILERIRDQIHASTPAPADFHLGPRGERTVFALDQISGITWSRQDGDDPPHFSDGQLNVELARIIAGTVDRIAFGKYRSPDYEAHPGEFIPPVGTRTGRPAVLGMNEIYFNLFVPSGRPPDSGWPVAIFGHGNSAHRHLSFNVAATMAEHGIATLSINAPGHGFGPLGTLTVEATSGERLTFPAGGRGMDQNGDHVIENNEGFGAAAPRTIIFYADGIRQTAADLMQLVRVIEVGIDVDGDGSPDLDPSRIYYFGHSLGGNYGTVFLAVEPDVQVGVPNSAGSPIIDNRRLNPGARGVLGGLLASRQPPLINSPGVSSLDGVSVAGPRFNENFPLRDGLALAVGLTDGTRHQIESPLINTVEGSIEIQELVKNTEWVGQQGSPIPYAPHLRKSPLFGVPAKSVIYQFGKGDQSAANPNLTAILRAGELADRTLFYRHDLAFPEIAGLPTNPHGAIVATDVAPFIPIALAIQEQIAVFFASDGNAIIHPEPENLFEVPIVPPLPEALSYIVP